MVLARKNLNVVFRVDASRRIGTGHVSRCLNLARSLARHGAAVTFVTRALEGHLIDLIASSGFAIQALPAPTTAPRSGSSYESWLEVSVSQDAEDTRRALASLQRCDWLVVDHYALDRSWHARMRPVVDRILVIDDLANREHDCDMLLDQNALGKPQRYEALAPRHCLRLLGPDFALLGPEYSELRHTVLPRGGAVQRVVVFFGGIDEHDMTSRTLRALRSLEPCELTLDVVAGVRHSNFYALKALIDAMPGVHLREPQATLAPLFAKADLAIGAGGVTMWERCCLGLPSIVVTIAENQIPGSAAAHEAGLVTCIGYYDNVDEVAIREAFVAALPEAVRLRQSALAAGAVDGLGARRVSSLIKSSDLADLRLRRAIAADESRVLLWANDPDARRHALDPKVISQETHHRWFGERLRDAEGCRMFVAETAEHVCLGQVRFDRTPEAWKIGYTVDAAFRNRGLGKLILSLGMEALWREFPGAALVGFVKNENSASHRIFASLGFQKSSADRADVTRYERRV